MGNKLSRKKQVVEERYTRPHGLYANKDVDVKRLRKLILETKLAPCYPGDDECCHDREECPICFLYYPSLNRSRCCMKSICTECFLQMKNPDSTCPTQCPFCKTSNYAVEYRGVKTKEEKGMEQMEEQLVIEAQIRMRQEELEDEEERTKKRHEFCSLSTSAVTGEMEYAPSAEISCNSTVEEGEIVSCLDSCASSTIKQPLRSSSNRDDEFDVDLEDLMVMEAIWLSIQGRGGRGRMPYGNFASCGPYASEDRYISPSTAPIPESSASSSPSGGLACAVAALVERQQMTGESWNNIHSIDMHPSSSTSYYNPINMENSNSYSLEIAEPERQSYRSSNTTEDNDADGISSYYNPINMENSNSYCLEIAEPEIQRYRSSNTTEDNDADGISMQGSGSFLNIYQQPPPIMPESYEEQMMLAMTVSLAEVHAPKSVTRGVAWQ